MKELGSCIALILVLFGLPLLIRLIMSGLGAGASAAVRSATGKGSFSGNFSASMWGLSKLEYRLRPSRLGDKDDGPLVQLVELKGLFPVSRLVRLAAVTHVYDADTKLPLACALDQFQEPDSIVFQFRTELGPVRPDQGFADWTRVGAVLPEIMRGPVGGRRRLHVLVRFIDLDNPPPIKIASHPPGHPGVLWMSDLLSFDFDFKGKGFQEIGQEQEDALAAAIRVAVFMAMADGAMHEAEGRAINAWIQKVLSEFGELKQSSLKVRLNTAFKEAFHKAGIGDLDLDEILVDLETVEDSSLKYQVLQLAFDVLAADKSVDSSEMVVIDQIAAALDLDVKEVEQIRDQTLIRLGENAIETASLDDVLGIRGDWDRDTVQRHLRSEFQKWNGRLNSLQEGLERQNAQRMLDMIAQARKKYA